ncbi:MAG: GTPase [Clostridia bacterium]|nr:GTPase [Clostridia bacterium]MBQ9482334.1 GTPase [Clostridia bacterium]
MAREVPVYMFLGFLESGKTSFIQETLEDPRFDTGDRTLVLLCEEGEVELQPRHFNVADVYIETVENEEDLNEKNLGDLLKKYRADRVLVEYNGMWALKSFFEGMPNGWMVNQIMTFFDSNTFLNYNANMRQQVFDKIELTDLVVFNRFDDEIGKMALHKVVRAISRRPQIVYEYPGGLAEADDIVDPLPFDVNAPVIEIADKDYALFYRDLIENVKNYDGKKVKFKGIVARDRTLPSDTFVCGRHVMTCCEADIAYKGLVAVAEGPADLKNRDWVVITAEIKYTFHKLYGAKGPVLFVRDIIKSNPPEEKVATFF